MGDMWKYELISNQWEVVTVMGISRITRDLFLWNGTLIQRNIGTQERLADDKDPETSL